MPPSFHREDLTARVAGVIARAQKIPPESVTPDKSFADLKIDSLDGINILFALESEFDVEIPDAAANEIRSVSQAVDGIEKLLAAKAAGATDATPASAASGSQSPE